MRRQSYGPWFFWSGERSMTPRHKARLGNRPLTSDCVNHTSRKHYPGGHDRLWLVERGKFRLLDTNKDQIPEP
jgi:hypothetical protein